ncbi:hypothetical protein V2K52_05225 [Pseudomonas alliivorans]|nr:hypothetical protein [Pseudomonas alliivorans]MEE4786907.1 hypothetical protein [Pseudomonas alliivorans]MEE4792411.1 hypothetical protein [Pseudomonas alliivorans]MEE4796486.1 hypothetical protein [Pseudomonas alliivorans]MEE4806650.1 hypothetical protein [Pseudomonas alliivorans]
MSNEIEKYLHIKARIEQADKHVVDTLRQEHSASRRLQMSTKCFWFCVLAPLLLAVLIALAGLLEPMRWIYYTSWGLIAVSYGALFVYPVLCIGRYRDSVRNVVAAPFASLAGINVRTRLLIDEQFLPLLTALSSHTLALGVLELKNERSGFERRLRLATGVLQNIGIVPGLLALSAGLISLCKTLLGMGSFVIYLDWVFTLAAVNLFLYLLCGYAQTVLTRDDRMIALTELAMERKKG